MLAQVGQLTVLTVSSGNGFYLLQFLADHLRQHEFLALIRAWLVTQLLHGTERMLVELNIWPSHGDIANLLVTRPADDSSKQKNWEAFLWLLGLFQRFQLCAEIQF